MLLRRGCYSDTLWMSAPTAANYAIRSIVTSRRPIAGIESESNREHQQGSIARSGQRGGGQGSRSGGQDDRQQGAAGQGQPPQERGRRPGKIRRRQKPCQGFADQGFEVAVLES